MTQMLYELLSIGFTASIWSFEETPIMFGIQAEEFYVAIRINIRKVREPDLREAVIAVLALQPFEKMHEI